ncbi:MAG: PIG-L family deacetylase [Acidimicrobiia bacterium]
MNETPCALFVHAHPDDEASKGSATVAKLVDRGVRCVLVCCTGGEAGEILNPSVEVAAHPEILGEVRRAELEESCAILGFAALHWLGFRDSGMPDSDANAHPENFANAPEAEAVGRLVEILRGERPQVVIGYAEDREFYAHPDHVRVHEITRAAFAAAGVSDRFPDRGGPWAPSKLYEVGFTRRSLVALADAHDQAGADNPFREWLEMWEASGIPDEDHRYRTRVEVGEYLHKRRASLLAHRTQIDPESFWMQLTDAQLRAAYPYEDYKLVAWPGAATLEVDEDDLFAGLFG